jgi:hypothetical protein
MTKIFRKKKKIGKEAGSGFILLLLLKLLFIFFIPGFACQPLLLFVGIFIGFLFITKNAE